MAEKPGGAKSKKEKKVLHLHRSGSTNASLSSMKPKERKGRVQQPASSGTNLLKSRLQNDRSESVKGAAMSKKQYWRRGRRTSSKMQRNTSDISAKTPSDYSSEDDSDVTFMSRKQATQTKYVMLMRNLDALSFVNTGSLQDLLRRSSSYKKALIRAQSQTDLDDDSPVDCVPDIQGV
ncbi:LOW QUALITY PROTEIN: hypothetical protein HID58_085459 [Brassica napus]|uniref:Uncharacterized protein n=1 Tax=Brassica napus TaxID=3708 RepID=A0ABQ7XMM6_BRANA|nr:LOW QUALITY PROTEIN: hypothetical protein HID58_085459 [Brassica napus]